MSETQRVSVPVNGIVIPRSQVKTLGLIVLAVLFFPVGCFLVWAKVQTELFGPSSGGREITWYGLLLGILGVVGAPIMVYQLARSLWVQRRLIIGSDRIQIVESLDGADVVVFQIPFANIALVEYEVTATDRRVAIDLNNPDDPESFAEDVSFRAIANSLGRHYCITEAFQDGPDEIADEIKQALKSWSAK